MYSSIVLHANPRRNKLDYRATGCSGLERTGAVGAHDRVLEKPYQLDELVRTIRGMLEARVQRAPAQA